jgi:PPOX class probable F420-dependent enzyme
MSREGTLAIDEGTEKGAHAAARLRRELIIWMTTVDAAGMPQTSPVWFLWRGGDFLVFSKESARIRNLEANPLVSLNLDGNGQGGDILVVEGRGRIERAHRSAAEVPAYVEKYSTRFERNGWTPEWFSRHYPVPLVIEPTRYRYW